MSVANTPSLVKLGTRGGVCSKASEPSGFVEPLLISRFAKHSQFPGKIAVDPFMEFLLTA